MRETAQELGREAGTSPAREQRWGMIGGTLGSLYGVGAALIALLVEGAPWWPTPETSADPALLAHLARESVAWRDGAVSLRFDPACYAARVPVDGWPLLPRITAPTLVVRGERSPILPRPMAERLRAELPGARLVEIRDAYHHLVLDRPDAFAHALRGFLDGLDGSGMGAAVSASRRPAAT